MAESPAPVIAVTSTERSWRNMSEPELAISNLNSEIEKLNLQINAGNPNASISPRPDRPADTTSSADISDFQNAVTEHRQDQFEATQFDEGNDERVRHLRLTLDSLEEDRRIVENGGKKQDELIDMYAAAERERMEKLEEKSRQK